ncbi:hypothetical protein A1D22_09460 [Pasteurellaceae bacterium LFhippo2]|nr:hypothetical protein [Pasteurellaceae bacterium LFhippo2]
MANIYCCKHLTAQESLLPFVQDLVQHIQSHFTLYPTTIGNSGGFEENPRAMIAKIRKVHIAVSDADFDKWRNKTGQQRKSDNYLIYTIHDFEDDILILDFISPEAHKRIKNRLADLVLIAEDFQDSYPEKFAEKYNQLFIE